MAVREKLPYRLDDLQWDAQHHFNSQNKYGYSGRGRKLGDPVLQCEMCMQWFPAKEVGCIEDLGFVAFQRNYRFLCRICSDSEEQFELLTNTWSSIALTAIYNLLLTADSSSLGEPKQWLPIDDIQKWIKEHWGSLTHGRNMSQLLVNKAVPKCLHHAHNQGELIMSGDKSQVTLRHTAPSKLKLKPIHNGTVTAGSAIPKKERDSQSNNKRKRSSGAGRVGSVAGRGGAGADSAPVTEIKLPDKYRLVPAPRIESQHASQDSAVVQLSRLARASQVTLRDDMLSAVGYKGYRMIRATHGVRAGSWYFEIRVGQPQNGEDAHVRLGWSTEMGELQAPVGYDKNSYSYRDVGGTKFHESAGSPYGEAYAAGDVIGCHLQMGDPPASVRQRQRIAIKGVEYIVEEEVERTVSRGSYITFYKNGASQGTAFSDIWAEEYFPAASMYKSALVTFNFGPKFDFPPSSLNARPCSELAKSDSDTCGACETKGGGTASAANLAGDTASSLGDVNAEPALSESGSRPSEAPGGELDRSRHLSDGGGDGDGGEGDGVCEPG